MAKQNIMVEACDRAKMFSSWKLGSKESKK
jgi:hypothetical protein